MLSNCRSVGSWAKDSQTAVPRVSGVDATGPTVGASGADVRPATRHENGLLALPAAGFTLEPFWLGYLVALLVCVGWAWRLTREAQQRDADTTDREGGV